MNKINEINAINESMNADLYMLESVLELLRSKCINLEFNSRYSTNKLELSKERNHYINVIGLALEKLEKIQAKNFEIENIILK